MTDPKHIELIEKYFDGELTEDERHHFGVLIDENEAFKAEFKLFEKAQKVVEMHTLSELKDQVKKLDTGKSVQKGFSGMRIAASFVLIAAAGIFLLAQLRFSNSALYKNSYIKPPDYLTQMGEAGDSLTDAMLAYNGGKYVEAISLFNVHAKTDAIHFFLGHCYMQIGKTDLAIEQLSAINGAYHSEAQWYLALAYLQGNDADKAQNILRSIINANTDPVFVTKANQLNKDLRNPLRKIIF